MCDGGGSILVYIADQLQNQLHKVISFCNEKMHYEREI